MSALLLKIGLAAAVAVALAGGGYWKGRTDGRAAMMKDTIRAYAQREGIDNEIADDDYVALCVRLGGLPDECEQLRGVEAHSR